MRPLALLLVLYSFVPGCSESEPQAAPAGGARPGPPPALVELGDVSAGSVTDGWVFLGQVQPALEAEIAAAVSGHVLEVAVREGDAVVKGGKLVRLDAAEVGARMAAARARLRGIESELVLAERQLERVAKLDFPTVSEPEKERFQQTAENLRAQKETQQAELRRVQVEYGRHLVRAPFSGAVRSRNVDPGAWVNVGQPIIALVSTGQVEIHVDVTAELGTRLATGQTATLIGPDRAQATIAGVVPALDAATGTMRVRLVPDERPPWLIAGMPIDVEFAITFSGSGDGSGDGVTVHPDALVRSPVGVRVIKVDQGKGVPIDVQVLASTRDKALIKGDGLAAGDKVVVRGNERLRPGQPLQVRE